MGEHLNQECYQILVAPALGGYEFESVEMLAFFAAEEEALGRGDIVTATEFNLKMWVDGLIGVMGKSVGKCESRSRRCN